MGIAVVEYSSRGSSRRCEMAKRHGCRRTLLAVLLRRSRWRVSLFYTVQTPLDERQRLPRIWETPWPAEDTRGPFWAWRLRMEACVRCSSLSRTPASSGSEPADSSVCGRTARLADLHGQHRRGRSALTPAHGWRSWSTPNASSRWRTEPRLNFSGTLPYHERQIQPSSTTFAKSVFRSLFFLRGCRMSD